MPTGCKPLDDLLGGGFPSGSISLVYGEAETGKSALAIQCAINCARIGYKTLFIDSDGTFSAKRLAQIAYSDYRKISPLIILVNPVTFQEQATTIDRLERFVTGKFGLIIFDTITSLYRVELASQKETFHLNRELNRQVALVAQLVRTHKLAALIISQVRSVLRRENDYFEPVATRILNFWANVVLNLRHTSQPSVKKVLLEKHFERSDKSCFVKIEETGICG